MTEIVHRRGETIEQHCLRRLRERYGLEVGPWFLNQLERLARKGATTVIGDTQNCGRVHRHDTDSRRIYFMISTRTDGIVTILDEPSALAMAVRKETARDGRGGRGGGQRGPMADQLDAIRARLFAPGSVADPVDIRDESVERAPRDVRERPDIRVREGD